jgi:hypothetical protein
MDHVFKHEQLPSGKTIIRHFGDDGSLVEETHGYGVLDIAIKYDFTAGIKVDETYFAKRRMVSRRTYEKARTAYTDMPTADLSVEDFGASLLRDERRQQRQNKAEAERRLAQSAESRFLRPLSTNWLRVISGERWHLVLFSSRDWKVLSRERDIPKGREWLHAFGFDGTVSGASAGGSVARGLEVGFEMTGNRDAMLGASHRLLTEVNEFAANPPEISQWTGSMRPRRKPKRMPPVVWPTALPPLIEFLSGLQESTVTIFNHHR